MRSVSIRSTRPDRKTTTPPQQRTEPSKQKPSPFDDLHVEIEKRAYALYGARGYRNGSALDDWLDAEREILSQLPSASEQ